MHPADIQAALKKKGITQAAIAKELKVSTFHVSDVINRSRTSKRVMIFISEKIGLDLWDVFPSYFFRKNRRQKKAA